MAESLFTINPFLINLCIIRFIGGINEIFGYVVGWDDGGGVEAINFMNNAAAKFTSFVGKAKTPQDQQKIPTPQERLKTNINAIKKEKLMKILETYLAQVHLTYANPGGMTPSHIQTEGVTAAVNRNIKIVSDILTQEKLLKIIDTYTIYDKDQSRIKINRHKLDDLKKELVITKDAGQLALHGLHLVDVLEYTLNEILKTTPSAQSPQRHSHRLSAQAPSFVAGS